jgi:hypothetical protein
MDNSEEISSGVDEGSVDRRCNVTNTSKPSAKPSLNSVTEMITNIKELVLAIGLLGGLAIWIMNYFATQERLDELACETTVKTKMLQAKEFVDITESHAVEASSRLTNEQQVYDRLRIEISDRRNASIKSALQDDIANVKSRMDALAGEIDGYKKSVDEQLKVTIKGSEILDQHVCLVKEQRDLLVKSSASWRE